MKVLGKYEIVKNYGYTIQATINAVALLLVAWALWGLHGVQNDTKDTADTAASVAEKTNSVARTAAKLAKTQSKIVKSNTRNIKELQAQKANILGLKRTNCGVRLAMLEAAKGADRTRGPGAGNGYRDIAELFSADNCKGLGALSPKQGT